MATFRREKVKVMDQSVRSIQMSPFLKIQIFGLKSSFLFVREVMYESNKVLVYHSESLDRMQHIFTRAEVLAFQTEWGGGIIHMVYGKVVLQRGGR
eukprot:8685527-Ditylum_brightwellii.AAC.2